MTDNVTANPASGGATFATDFNSSETAHWPIQKVAFGTRDSVYTVVDATHQLPVKTTLIVTETDASQTVGVTAVTAITAGTATKWVDIMNVSANGNLVGYTFDGSIPVIGNAGTKILLPYGSAQYIQVIPNTALQVIGSAASTLVAIKYA